MTDTLLIDRADGVVTLTFNRPDALNALTDELKAAFRDQLAALAADPTCRALVLAGTGRAFCVGQDLREHVANLQAGIPLTTVREHYNPIAATLAAMPKPVVAAVRGAAAGAGASLAFLADFRVGGPGTSFSMAFAGIGLTSDTGASLTLPRLVGHAKATEMLMLGTKVKAEEALRIGLVGTLTETDEDVLPEAQKLAARLAEGPTVAYAYIKRTMSAAEHVPLSETLDLEAEAQLRCSQTEDHRSAVESFVAKRPIVFEGR
ncbi:MAG TPA: enoyl-CoA hydratase-related protein [Phytomonospora sp.]